jgi:serine-type D-Ala-D-Ala carboxypeptidase/endopeptidase (penicillin-binding protein 4)
MKRNMTTTRLLAKALLPALAVLSTACATAPRASPTAAPARTLDVIIDSIADTPPLHRAHWGIHVVDATTGDVVYARNADRHFIPASNMKLVTGAVALGVLGETYRYTTDVLAGGRDDDTVEALVVVGSGDPTWSTRFHPTATAPLDSIAVLVAAAGIRSVAELIIDASLFTDDRVRGVWEVADLPWRTAAPTDAFAAAEGTFRVVMTGGRSVGSPGAAAVIGEMGQPLRAEVVTDTAGAPARLRIDFTARRDTIHLTGSVGPGAADTSTLAVTRPAESAAEALAAALQRAGIDVGTTLVVRDTSAARLARSATLPLARYTSAPLSDIVVAFMLPSQNWIAEQLVKTLGAEAAQDGSWAGGLGAAREYLSDIVGIDTAALNLRDGSGLSPQNLITPAATTALLMHARMQPWAATFRASLPQPGQSGGTLSNRLAGLEGRVLAKTGTISNVGALSGYITGADGRELIFSILVNGTALPSAPTRDAIDVVVRFIAGYTEPGGVE